MRGKAKPLSFRLRMFRFETATNFAQPPQRARRALFRCPRCCSEKATSVVHIYANFSCTQQHTPAHHRVFSTAELCNPGKLTICRARDNILAASQCVDRAGALTSTSAWWLLLCDCQRAIQFYEPLGCTCAPPGECRRRSKCTHRCKSV